MAGAIFYVIVYGWIWKGLSAYTPDMKGDFCIYAPDSVTYRDRETLRNSGFRILRAILMYWLKPNVLWYDKYRSRLGYDHISYGVSWYIEIALRILATRISGRGSVCYGIRCVYAKIPFHFQRYAESPLHIEPYTIAWRVALAIYYRIVCILWYTMYIDICNMHILVYASIWWVHNP